MADQVVPWIEVLLHTLIDWMRTEGEEGREVNHHFGFFTWIVEIFLSLKQVNHHGKTITVGGNKDADKDPLLDKVTQWEKQNRQ